LDTLYWTDGTDVEIVSVPDLVLRLEEGGFGGAERDDCTTLWQFFL